MQDAVLSLNLELTYVRFY